MKPETKLSEAEQAAWATARATELELLQLAEVWVSMLKDECPSAMALDETEKSIIQLMARKHMQYRIANDMADSEEPKAEPKRITLGDLGVLSEMFETTSDTHEVVSVTIVSAHERAESEDNYLTSVTWDDGKTKVILVHAD